MMFEVQAVFLLNASPQFLRDLGAQSSRAKNSKRLPLCGGNQVNRSAQRIREPPPKSQEPANRPRKLHRLIPSQKKFDTGAPVEQTSRTMRSDPSICKGTIREARARLAESRTFGLV